MKHEDGFCDECGCRLPAIAWLTLDGQERCAECAVASQQEHVGAKRPEARDDGR